MINKEQSSSYKVKIGLHIENEINDILTAITSEKYR